MTQALRIAIVAPPYHEVPPRGYGGTELICYLLAEGLVDSGHDVTVIGAGARGTRARFVAIFDDAQPEGGADAARIDRAHERQAAAVIRELRPDVVHLHTRTARPADVSGRVPTVMTIHGAVRGPDSSAVGLAGAARQASVVAISRSQLSSAPRVRWAGMVHNGIDLRRYPCGGRRQDSRGAVLYLGRISPHKGTHLAVDAARAAGRRLIIAGGWTIPAEREYFDAAIRPRLGDDVVWLGEVGFARKVDLLRQAACLLFPACWREPFGLVLVEAMACGTPVVALRSGAVPELVIDRETGILCGSPAELPEAIGEAGGLDARRCRAHVERHFSAAGMVAGYQDIYRRAIGPASLPHPG